MKSTYWLREATDSLEKAEIGTARLDCLVLLEDVTGKDRSWLLAHPEYELSSSQVRKLEDLLKLRIKHEPLAYVRGKTEFFGREFIISKDVLEPRPESETMIELLKGLSDIKSIADIGTGSGALAITAKLELPAATVFATDIDMKCLDVAKKNAKKQNAKIEFHQGNLLASLPTNNYPLTTILANLPYVPNDYTINQAAAMEPKVAIFGGPDGLDLYRELFAQIAQRTQKPRYVLSESLPFQHKVLETIAKSSGYKLQETNDFIQIFEN